jgi:N-methylhydantoinase B
MVNPDIPHNEGMVEPIEIVIPEGTILNAAYPKATTFGNHLCPPNADAIQRALGARAAGSRDRGLEQPAVRR